MKTFGAKGKAKAPSRTKPAFLRGSKPSARRFGSGRWGAALGILTALPVLSSLFSDEAQAEESSTAETLYDIVKTGFESVGPPGLEQGPSLGVATGPNWFERTLGIKPIELGSGAAPLSLKPIPAHTPFGAAGGAGGVGTVIVDIRLNGQAVQQVMADTATQQYVSINIGSALGVK